MVQQRSGTYMSVFLRNGLNTVVTDDSVDLGLMLENGFFSIE